MRTGQFYLEFTRLQVLYPFFYIPRHLLPYSHQFSRHDSFFFVHPCHHNQGELSLLDALITSLHLLPYITA